MSHDAMNHAADPASSRRGRLAGAVRAIAVTVESGAALVTMAWIAGRVLTDSFQWSQFLWWIPTPVALGGVLIGALASWRFRPGRRRPPQRALVWIVALAIGVLSFVTVEHHFFRGRGTPGPDDLRIFCWTMTHAKRDIETHQRFVTEQAADISFLSHAYGLDWPLAVGDMLGPEGRVVRVGVFFILTRIPILEVRPLIARDNIEVSFVRFDTQARWGRALGVYLVDLPSDPRIGREAQARQIATWLETVDAPPADLIVGDFNTPRGSGSLQQIFPGYRHAYDDAGRGYAASYHRTWPLYHIDHILLGPNLAATTYRLIDPHVGRHGAQQATIGPSGK